MTALRTLRAALAYRLAVGAAGLVLGLTAPAHASFEATPGGAVAAADDGASWRIPTAFGPVRVWIPRGYDPARAQVVVYVHGYYVDADTAWREHRLAAQFAASRRNAVFIACDAPEDSAERVSWRSLPRLLEVVARATKRPLPAGPVIAIAHGGGARTVLGWLGSDRLRAIALLDTAFVPARPFTKWSARPGRRLVHVVTERGVLPPGAAPRDPVLAGFAALAAAPPADAARTFVRTSLRHRALAADGVAIPTVLRALAPALPGATDDEVAPRRAPARALADVTDDARAPARAARRTPRR